MTPAVAAQTALQYWEALSGTIQYDYVRGQALAYKQEPTSVFEVLYARDNKRVSHMKRKAIANGNWNEAKVNEIMKSFMTATPGYKETKDSILQAGKPANPLFVSLSDSPLLGIIKTTEEGNTTKSVVEDLSIEQANGINFSPIVDARFYHPSVTASQWATIRTREHNQLKTDHAAQACGESVAETVHLLIAEEGLTMKDALRDVS